MNTNLFFGGRRMNRNQSEQLFKEAEQHIVGGVNSPSRHFKAVGGGAPVFMKKASGAYFWDVDGNKYIDYLSAYGPIITGHAHPKITEAIKEVSENGILFGTPTELEITFAKKLKEAIPSLDKVRFTNSGTEAVMSTIRVARAYTKRNKIVKFSGCYHGHADLVLVEAGSGPSTLGTPDSAGVPESIAQEVITVPFNETEPLKEAIQKFGDDIAAVLVEPIVGNFGIVEPNPGFLEEVKQLTHNNGSLLIYDEVITAFRFHYGSAQELTGVTADLTALGKIIGGGTPIGAYGGRADIMEQVAPLGPTYQAGTMAGNPLSMAAGIACLTILNDPQIYEELDRLGGRLEEGILSLASKYNIPITINRLKGALTVFFTDKKVMNYEDAENSDGEMFAKFFKQMLKHGVNLAPSKYEAWFLTMAHTDKEIDETLKAVDQSFKEMSQN